MKKQPSYKITNVYTEHTVSAKEKEIEISRMKMLDLFMCKFRDFLPFNKIGLLEYNPIDNETCKEYELSDNYNGTYKIIIDYDASDNRQQYYLKIEAYKSNIVTKIIPNYKNLIYVSSDEALVQVFYVIVRKLMDYKRFTDFDYITRTIPQQNLAVYHKATCLCKHKVRCCIHDDKNAASKDDSITLIKTGILVVKILEIEFCRYLSCSSTFKIHLLKVPTKKIKQDIVLESSDVVEIVSSITKILDM